MDRSYGDFVMYGSENVLTTQMPATFTEKRQFPVLLAMPNVDFNTLSVLVLLTGSSPISSSQDPVAYQQIVDVFNLLGLSGVPGANNMTPSDPIGGIDNDTTVTLEYVIGAAEATVYYVSGFDPNQLVVENITPTNDGLYKVTFRLDICNEGQAAVDSQNVCIRYPDGVFWGFQYLGDNANGNGNPVGYAFESNDGGLWKFNLEMMLIEPPIPRQGQPHQEVCGSIYFTALTNCEGVRALWRENGGRVVEACVVFPESIGQLSHCGYNTPIESDQFKNADGSSICAPDAAQTCPPNKMCNWWYCLLLLLIILLILLWLVKSKYIPWLSKLFS